MPVGYLEANCYIVFDRNSKDAIIIDPGNEPGKILSEVEQRQLKPLTLINTHDHFDHTGANEVLKRKFNLDIYHPVTNGEIKSFGTLKLKFFLTPGHSADGISILIENHLFSGDTLFAGTVGRTDFLGGNKEQLLDSIKNKLLKLPKEIIVHPGHGPDTTIEDEIKDNPHL